MLNEDRGPVAHQGRSAEKENSDQGVDDGVSFESAAQAKCGDQQADDSDWDAEDDNHRLITFFYRFNLQSGAP